MRSVLAFVCAFLIPVTAAAADWTLTLKEIDRVVLRLEALEKGQPRPYICSGVVINAKAGFLLTAAHCIPNELDSMTVSGRHAELVRRNALLDLAVVRFEPKLETHMPLADVTPSMGSEVAVVGFAFGVEEIHTQFGHISRPLNRETKTVWLNVDTIIGDSGGAVIDTNGRLIGVTSRIYSKGPMHMGAAIPVEQVRDFVVSYLPQE